MEIVDFANKTGKNIGEPQNTKLGEYFETNERNIRYLKQTDKKMFDCLYIGAFCEANNIKKDDLLLLLEIKNRLAKNS